MSHIYRVPKRDGSFVLVQATTGPRALSEARKAVFDPEAQPTRLTPGQIVAAVKQGVDILVVDADPIESDVQPDLEGIEAAE